MNKTGFTCLTLLLLGFLWLPLGVTADTGEEDADGDGYPDAVDSCPADGDFFGYGVDEYGCPNPPPDADGDGVPDDLDVCPDLGDIYGQGVDGNGCPYYLPDPDYDSDGDGIYDESDSCPYEGDKGYGVDPNGCPNQDSDADGYWDFDDACPYQGDEGYGVDGSGCPYSGGNYDSDGDGVMDDQDNCLLVQNPDQLDVDSDGLGNACDAYSMLMEKAGAKWSRFGGSLAFGDVNLDGIPDLVVLAPTGDGDAGTPRNAGEIWIVSGADGGVLQMFSGWQVNQRFAAVAVAPDQNSDGVPDILVGEPFVAVNHPAKGTINRAGRISLLSGANGSWLGTVVEGDRIQGRLGSALAVGDLNGDGKADLVVGAPHAQIAGHYRAGEVIVFDGISNTVLYRRGGDQVDAHFGAAVAVADGQLFIGEPERDTAAGVDAGRVSVFDANDGSSAPLFMRDGSTAGAGFGTAVAAYGNRWAVSASVGSDGVVSVYESSASAPLLNLSGNAGEAFGKALAMTDLNGDSKPDLAVGMPRSSTSPQPKEAGRVQVFDGAGW